MATHSFPLITFPTLTLKKQTNENSPTFLLTLQEAHDPIIMEEEIKEPTTMIMAALSTLTPSQLTDLTDSILTRNLHHHHRLFSLLSSSPHFSLTLHHLHSLSLPSKTLLISKHLLSSLQLLALHFYPRPLNHFPFNPINQRDLDAALLLLLLCDTHKENPELLDKTPQTRWREVLRERFCGAVLKEVGSVGVHYGGVLLPYVEMVIRCWRFVSVCSIGGEKEGTALEAAALQRMEVGGGGEEECVICKEVMEEGRRVCELPCGHLFHWKCVLPWFKKRNTCPCCRLRLRLRLPSEDVIGEIQRLWGVLERVGDETYHTWQ